MAREALDAILASAVFDQAVSVLFCGDGVWQLLPEQEDLTGSDKPLARSLAALPLYDVDAIYVDADSLRERGLSPGDLLPLARLAAPEQVRQLLGSSDRLMCF